MEEINIKDFFQYIKKYSFVIIILAAFLLVDVLVYEIIYKKPMYTTYTTLVLVKDDTNSRESGSTTISQSDISINKQLVSTYSQIVKSKLILQQVLNKLNLEYTIEELSKSITVEAVEDTEILKISVTNLNPAVAAQIANSIAEVFEKEIKQIYNISNISIIDKAEVPLESSNNTMVRDIILALFVGIFGGTGIIFLIFYFDDTLRSMEDLENNSENHLPIIGKIFKEKNLEKYNSELIIEENPKSVTSENIRTLRTNLQFSSVDDRVKVLLVTSTIPGEGKSFVSSNLAASFAQAGKKVLLVDCDLRKGRQHRFFHLMTKQGLSNLLVEDINDYEKYVHSTDLRNLYVLTRGVIPPNPSELLSSKKMEKLIKLLRTKYDIIILDGTPCTSVSDSLALTTSVDKVLLVCSMNYTPKKELQNTIKSLENVGSNIAGFIVNNMKFDKSAHSQYYYYESQEK